MRKSSRITSTSNRRPTRSVARLEAYFETRANAWQQALAAARSRFAVEGIHELRVETKRLRALYRLVAYVNPGFAAKSGTRPLRDLFRTAGTLRDIDVRQAIVIVRLRRFDLREYFNELKHEELAARRVFVAVADAATLSITKQRMLAALADMTDEDIRARIEKKIRKLACELIATVRVKRPNTGELHAVRKVSKALRYTLDVHQALFGESPAINRAAVRLKRAYGHLGDWHDAALALTSTKEFLRHYKAARLTAPDAYGEFKAELRKEMKRLRAAYDRDREPLLRVTSRLSGTNSGKTQSAPGHRRRTPISDGNQR